MDDQAEKYREVNLEKCREIGRLPIFPQYPIPYYVPIPYYNPYHRPMPYLYDPFYQNPQIWC